MSEEYFDFSAFTLFAALQLESDIDKAKDDTERTAVDFLYGRLYVLLTRYAGLDGLGLDIFYRERGAQAWGNSDI